MSVRRNGLGALAVALVAGGCRHADPATAPMPVPPGDPPSVQAPVGSAPIVDIGAPPASNVPDPQLRRYDVVAVDETTFTILVGPARWVRRGTTGVAVDPRRRDALVARFRILGRTGDSAVALVTGQTTHVSSSDVALIRQPVPSPLGQGTFWTGLFFGAAIGATSVLVIRH